MIDLRIHIADEAPWLERILDQERVPFVTNSRGSSSGDPNSSIIASTNKNLDGVSAKLIITNHDSLASFLGIETRKTKARSFVFGAKRGHAFVKLKSGDFSGQKNYQEVGFHLDKFNRRIPFSGVISIELAGTRYLSFPWKLDKFPRHWTRWSLYLSQIRDGKQLFCETTPWIDDRLVREAVFEGIVMGFQGLGAPIVRVSPRVSGELIAVRIDADGYSARSTSRVHDLALKKGVSFSWFIDVWSWKNELTEIKRLAASHEIGLHSFFHLTSIWAKSNIRNLRKGLAFLQDLGLEKIGFVAPFGHWNRGLSAAIKKLPISYSSEFAFSSDIIPSRESGVSHEPRRLQISTIPVSIGVWTGTADYWEILLEEIEARLDEVGHAVLYDHPLNRLEHQTEKLGELIDILLKRGCKFVSLAEVSEIYSQRPRISFANWSDGLLTYETEGHVDAEFQVETVWGDSHFKALHDQNHDLGIGRRNMFSIAWGRTIFFGLISVIPIWWHIKWANLRAFLSLRRS